MRRDLNLIREILLVAEAAKPGQRVSLKDFNDSHPDRLEEVSEHVQLLNRVGFLDVTISKALGTHGPRAFFINRIEWAGHDYLDAVRDPDIWSKTEQQLKKVGGSAALEVVKAVAVKIISQTLGL
ncbi:DUF2513 domain-containing protein [Nitrincola sp. MINF-07-Sa-05]|uniref:DUF2513 domain-containing protein n=1 Tax=Nitrincola salilacus TaxID=3400273 RepID=UPI003917EFEE